MSDQTTLDEDFEVDEFLDDCLEDEPDVVRYDELSPFERIGLNIGYLVRLKNELYGDSALKPLRVFSKLTPLEGIFVRLDDKISRIKNTKELRKNDVSDILGYLILLCKEKGWENFDEFID